MRGSVPPPLRRGGGGLCGGVHVESLDSRRSTSVGVSECGSQRNSPKYQATVVCSSNARSCKRGTQAHESGAFRYGRERWLAFCLFENGTLANRARSFVFTAV